MNKKQIITLLLLVILIGSTIGFVLAKETKLNLSVNLSNYTQLNSIVDNHTDTTNLFRENLSFEQRLIQANFGMQADLKTCQAQLDNTKLDIWIIIIAIIISLICIIDRLYSRFRKEK